MNGAILAANLTACLDAIATRGLAEKNAAGLVLRVERGERLIFENTWGLAVDLPDRSLPMIPDTQFDIASLTKLFTTTVALRLATLGRLDLDAVLSGCEPMHSLAAGRPLLAKAFSRITVRSLMAHSSGLHYWYPFYAAKAGPDFAPILEEILVRFPLSPGTVYSDLNYIILGKLVESAAGLPLDAALKDLVAGPLGLASTCYRPASGPFAATEFGNGIEQAMVAELGLSFDAWRDPCVPLAGEPDDGNCHYYFDDTAGHAGIFSTVRDACALGNLYLDLGIRSGFIDPGLADESRLDHGGGRGLGFQLGELYPDGGFGHTGFTGTYLYLNADLGLCAAIFANRLHVETPKNINAWRKELIKAILSDSMQGDSHDREKE
ncbi:MAG: serine hydrolase [Spirochaetes bacterium]|nr:serine hydrolase [Spirochaetota bacterium]